MEVVKCKWCKSKDVVKHGSVGTVKNGERQRYKCKECFHTFYVEENKKVGDKK